MGVSSIFHGPRPHLIACAPPPCSSAGNEYYGQIFRLLRDQMLIPCPNAPVWAVQCTKDNSLAPHYTRELVPGPVPVPAARCVCRGAGTAGTATGTGAGTYTRIQKCHGTCGAQCTIATTALVTATAHTHEPHTSVCSWKSRRAQSPRSWAGSKVATRMVLPRAHTA